MNNRTAIELFAGGGGVAVALRSLGYTVVCSVEREEPIAAVYAANHPNHPLHICSVADVDYRPYYGVDLLHASPPCQNYSNARSKELGLHPDWAIGLEVIRAVRETMPRIVTIENVVGYKTSEIFGEICKSMAKLGYWAIVHPATMDHHIYTWSDLGGPQKRRRLLARWVRGDARHTVNCHAEPVLFGVGKCWGAEPIARPSAGWYAATKDLRLPLGDLANWQVPAIESSRWADDVMRGDRWWLIPRVGARLDDGAIKWAAPADQPAPTVKALGHRQHWRQFNTIRSGRCHAITPRFLARLQGFPDWYKLPDVNYLAGKVVGNAVPPPFYEAIVGPLTNAMEVAA